ncbi:MAG TPA: hypothetical protein VHZ26_15405 [Caulobacteraceae bacterium]|jgi:hypothetical protein|nr:hypothetical protein [Caulobacteraceae bacterium]
MSSPARQLDAASPVPEPVTEATVVGAEIVGGHDGSAELMVSIRYENGVVASVALDADTGFSVMRACGAADLGGLIGRPWREISRRL